MKTNTNITQTNNTTNYLPLTTAGNIIATSSDNGTVTTDITVGVKMNNDTPADTYGTTLVFVATTDPIPTCNPNEICYKGNGSDGGTFMANQTKSTYNTTENGVTTYPNLATGVTTTLWAPNYRRAGYGFAGWSTDKEAATKIANNNGAVPSGVTIYGPNEDITLTNQDTASGLTLYAVWIESAGTMQNWTCPNNWKLPSGGHAYATGTPKDAESNINRNIGTDTVPTSDPYCS